MALRTEFGGRDVEIPFAAGSVYGIRSFQVVRCLDTDQQIWSGMRPGAHPSWYPLLVGPARNEFVYHDGANHAECGKLQESYSYVGHPRHRIATRDCTCGFYSYTAPRYNQFLRADCIGAVVKAYGHVTYGSMGFRTEKCEIVAAVNPHLSEEHNSWVMPEYYLKPEERFRRPQFLTFRQRHQIAFWDTRQMIWSIVGVEVALAIFMAIFTSWVALSPALLAVVFSVGIWEGRKGRALLRNHHQRCDNSVLWDVLYAQHLAKQKEDENEVHHSYNRTAISAEHFEQIAEKYPSIEWFPNASSMLAKYPLTQYKDLPQGKGKV